jgi:hypothetical protein
MSKKKNKLVFGVGINDAEYSINHRITVGRVNGKQVQKELWKCPYYVKWADMLKRCFSEKYKAKYPTYQDCTCVPEWVYFSKFRQWVDEQPNKDWQNCELDKDLLVCDNKVYGPETCVFINKQVNYFTLSKKGQRGQFMLGVVGITPSGKYRSGCQSPFTKSRRGCDTRHATELEAHKAWQAKKHEYACQLADLQEDPRVAEALRQRYAPDKDWTRA